jgi:hypothetical protein
MTQGEPILFHYFTLKGWLVIFIFIETMTGQVCVSGEMQIKAC